MKLSTELLTLWRLLEENFTALSTSIDCFGYPCRAWSQEAAAWDSTGILEYHYYDPATNKYSKGYDAVVKILRESMKAQSNIDPLPNDHTIEEYMTDIHSIWWGAILTARAMEMEQ